jgi:hypothetical protein
VIASPWPAAMSRESGASSAGRWKKVAAVVIRERVEDGESLDPAAPKSAHSVSIARTMRDRRWPRWSPPRSIRAQREEHGCGSRASAPKAECSAAPALQRRAAPRG